MARIVSQVRYHGLSVPCRGFIHKSLHSSVLCNDLIFNLVQKGTVHRYQTVLSVKCDDLGGNKAIDPMDLRPSFGFHQKMTRFTG